MYIVTAGTRHQNISSYMHVLPACIFLSVYNVLVLYNYIYPSTSLYNMGNSTLDMWSWGIGNRTQNIYKALLKVKGFVAVGV